MKKILLAISAVALMFAGCTKDLTNDVVNGGNIAAGELVVKNLVFEDTRLGRDDVSGKLAWSEGDKVCVVLQDENGALALDANTYTVDHLNSSVAVPSNTAYVIYMSKTPTLAGSVLSFDLPYNITIANPEDIFDINPMKGTIEGENIVFKNLLGYIKVPVKGTSKLKSVYARTICRTTSEFHPIAAASTLDLAKSVGSDGDVVMKSDNSAFAFLQCAFSTPLDISAGEDIYIAMPAGDYENMCLTFVTESGSHAIYANKSHTVTRSAIKPISASHIDLDAHTPANPVSLAGTTGKACEDYARCYMVPPTAGAYEFPCILADGTTFKSIVTAEVKWAEEAGMINDVHYNPETNKISFKTNGKKGNALIVATTGAAAATIIWTWHIWITDTPKTLKVVCNGNKNTYYLMDRVVGATWSPSSVLAETSTMTLNEKTVSFNNTLSLEDASNAAGVHFQYQNCNPLPRIKSLDFIGKENKSTMANTRCDVSYGFSRYSQYWSTSSSGANVYTSKYTNEGQTLYIHNGIQMPNYQYQISGKFNNNNASAWIKDSIVNHTKAIPGNGNQNVLISEGLYRLWNSVNNNNHDTMMSGKTAHDPCPPGYIVENYSVIYWYMVIDNDHKAKFGYTRAAEDNDAYNSGFKYYGMYYNDSVDKDGNNVPMYWPCDGNRDALVSGVSGNYSNCGYIYLVNTNNDNVYTVGDYKYGFAGAVAYGEVATSSYNAPDLQRASSNKQVNSQAYVVRCRRGKF